MRFRGIRRYDWVLAKTGYLLLLIFVLCMFASFIAFITILMLGMPLIAVGLSWTAVGALVSVVVCVSLAILCYGVLSEASGQS